MKKNCDFFRIGISVFDLTMRKIKFEADSNKPSGTFFNNCRMLSITYIFCYVKLFKLFPDDILNTLYAGQVILPVRSSGAQ